MSEEVRETWRAAWQARAKNERLRAIELDARTSLGSRASPPPTPPSELSTSYQLRHHKDRIFHLTCKSSWSKFVNKLAAIMFPTAKDWPLDEIAFFLCVPQDNCRLN